MITIKQVQERLTELGYDPGPADGIRGRRTINAVRTFQVDNQISADGLVGPVTAKRLFGETLTASALPDETPWMDVAARVRGLHEELHNDSLCEFLLSDGGSVGDPSRNPWCADFVQTCVALSMPDEPLPNNPYLSANWVRFGEPVIPCFGAILVFWRESPTSHLGHVAFYLDETDDTFVVRGGNQSDCVSDIHVDKDRLRPNGVRWPVTALPKQSGRRMRGRVQQYRSVPSTC